MGKIEKLIQRMRNNPLNWRIEDIKMLAQRYHIDFRQPGKSHVTFRFPSGQKLTVPAHKPIKPVYIKQFIELFDEEQKK